MGDRVKRTIGHRLVPPVRRRLSYGGDSLLNVMGDLTAGMVGFLAARRWSLGFIVTALFSIELLAAIMIADGLLIGSLRILGIG